MPNTPTYAMFIGVILVDRHWASPLFWGSSFYQPKSRRNISKKNYSLAIHPQRYKRGYL